MTLQRRDVLLGIGAGLALAGIGGPAFAETPSQDEIVTQSRITLDRIRRNQDLAMVPGFVAAAHAVMVFPSILKGAFIIGGRGGSGVLMARGPSGDWSYPAFYTLGALSIGLQIGAEASETILIVNTERGLNAILDDQVKLGGDISAAVGPIGVGGSAATTTAAGADVYSYSLNKGLFLGASLDGAVIARREDWNSAYYNQSVTPRQIVLERAVSNPRADELRQTLAGFSA